MEQAIFILLLASALLHATWNLILKSAPDKPVAVMAIFFTSLPLALAGLAIAGIPRLEVLPVVLLSAAIQTGYNISLFKAYTIGQLSSIYPVARGSAPLFVFVISLGLFGSEVSKNTALGIAVICTGLVTYGLVQLRRDGFHKKELMLALANGLCIALYSLTDAYGTRLAGNAVSFLGMMAVFNRAFLFAYLYFFEINFLPRLISGFERRYIIGGLISFVCYLMILFSYQYMPVPVVAAIRETSIIFAVILGAVFLKEKIFWEKVGLIATVLCGLLILIPF